MHRPLISFILIIIAVVVLLLISGLVEVEFIFEIHDEDGNLTKNKRKRLGDSSDDDKLDAIAEAEVVEEEKDE